MIWSPRQSAWIAGIAPDGREGIFLAMLSLKSLVTTIPSTVTPALELAYYGMSSSPKEFAHQLHL